MAIMGGKSEINATTLSTMIKGCRLFGLNYKLSFKSHRSILIGIEEKAMLAWEILIVVDFLLPDMFLWKSVG
ncbi:hypothetical protein ACLOJK_029183 [Asimina triloba]